MTQEPSASPLLAWSSLALFVTSALVSTWFSHEEELRHEYGRYKRGRRRERGGSFDYSLRRRQSRLSPVHHSRKSLFSEHVDNDEPVNPDDLLLALDSADFRPKNQNWNHFESTNEDDVKDGIVSPPASASSYNDSDVESDSSISDEFVWTSRQASTRRHSAPHVVQTTESHADTSPSHPDTSLTSSEEDEEEAVSTWTQIRRKISRHPLASFSKHAPPANDPQSSSESYTFDDGEDSFHSTSDLEREEKQRPTLSKMDETDPILHRRQGLDSSMWSLLSKSIPDMLHLERQTTAPQANKPEVAAYNASILPSKVIMIRHGQSEGNINESLYATTPDNAMRITKLGWDQAHKAGQALKEKILASGESVHFIVSPYVRTVETFHGIVSAWCDPSEFNHIEDRDERIKAWYGRLLEMGLTWHEDPRIREQDFGNYQDPVTIKKCKAERHKFGVFFYRFPHGESASDVFDRVSTFLDSLWRSFDLHKSRNYVLVTHGISIRVFLARYFRYSIDQFSMLANPKNCEMVILGHDGKGKLRLQGRCEMELNKAQESENDDENQVSVTGYKFHKRLRVLPKSAIRRLNIRVSFDD